jgi:hypothetical protein
MKKLAQLTALAATVAVAAVGPAAAMHAPGEGPASTQRTAPREPEVLAGDLHAVPQASTQVIRVVQTSGFDWADAAIGGGSAATAIGLAAAAALLARRRRPEAESAPSAATV